MMRASFVWIILLTATSAYAKKPACTLHIDTHTLEPDEAIDAQLVCTNTEQPSLPRVAVSDGLNVSLRNRKPFVSSRSSWINGRTSRKTTYTYNLQITAVKTGTHTLGPISVEAGGTTYETNPVRIVVRAGPVTSVPRGDRFLFAEIEVDRTSLYVTEAYRATLTIGIRKVIINGRQIDLNLLDLLDRQSSLSVFSGGKVRSSEQNLGDSDGTVHRYVVYRVSKEIRAEEMGGQAVGPVFLKMNYPTAVRRGFFGGYDVTRARRETAGAPAVPIEVKGPPEEDRPDSFTGAIGQFTMRVTAKPGRVEQDQPVTLTITIKGTPVQGVAGPDLSKNAQLVSRFEFAKDELIGDVEGNAKFFRRAIFPKQQGEQTIEPITWSFFDTRRREYVTLTSTPIPLTVDPPSATEATIALVNPEMAEQNGTALTLLSGGISPNYVDVDILLANHSAALTPPWMGALAAGPLIYLLVAVTQRRRIRLRGDTGFARRHHARRIATARIREALHSGEASEQLRGLSCALTGHLADRLNLPPGEITADEVRIMLLERGVNGSLTEEVVSFLQTCDQARYTPNAAGSLSIKENAARVRGWIKQMEQATR